MGRIPLLAVVSTCAMMRLAGAQGLPNRVEDLEARVAALEAGRTDVSVTCGADESVGEVLAEHAGRSQRLFIHLSGICIETVTISRNNVTIIGSGAGDGIRAPAGQPHAVRVLGANGITLAQMTLQADTDALALGNGAAVFGRNLEIAGGNRGVVIRGAHLNLVGSTIDRTLPGTLPQTHGVDLAVGTAQISATTIRNYNRCGICADGGSVDLRDTTVETNGVGIMAMGSTINASATRFRENVGTGVHAEGQTSFRMTDGEIAANGGGGVVMIASFASFAGSANDLLIERNGGPGIRARLNSIVRLGPSITIRAQGGGMQLSDGSVVFADTARDSVRITGNGRGVICLGSNPGSALSGYISSFGGEFHLNSSNVFGNSGPGPNIGCPGINVP